MGNSSRTMPECVSVCAYVDFYKQQYMCLQGQNTHVPDTEVMAELMAKHQTMMSILSSRQGTLQIVGSFWARGDVRGALAALLQSSGVLQLVPAHD